jgi:hypothetical protein
MTLRLSARLGFTVAAVAVFALLATVLYKKLASPDFLVDLSPFYCGARVMLNGADPYLVEPLRSCEQHVHPLGLSWLVMPVPLPGYAIAFYVPLALLPYTWARPVYAVILVAAVLLSAILTARITRLPAAVPILAYLLGIAWISVDLGQPVPLLVLALVYSAYFISRGRERLAGLAAVFAMIEPHVGLPVCVALFLWIPRSRPTILAGAAVLGIVSAVGLAIHSNLEYLTSVIPAHAQSEIVQPNQYSLTWLAYRFGLSEKFALEAGAVSYLFFGTAGVVVSRGFASNPLTRPLVALFPAATSVLFGSFVHLAQTMAALPAILVLLSLNRSQFRWYATALSLISVPWIYLLVDISGPKSTVRIAVFALAVGGLLLCSAWAILGSWRHAIRVACASAVFTAAFSALTLRFPPYVERNAQRVVVAGLPEAEPQGLASKDWGFYQHAVVDVPVTGRAYLLKLPTWGGLVLLLILGSARAATPRRGEYAASPVPTSSSPLGSL